VLDVDPWVRSKLVHGHRIDPGATCTPEQIGYALGHSTFNHDFWVEIYESTKSRIASLRWLSSVNWTEHLHGLLSDEEVCICSALIRMGIALGKQPNSYYRGAHNRNDSCCC
jgi:hypothetical protein